jgi:hypothetical protein
MNILIRQYFLFWLSVICPYTKVYLYEICCAKSIA